MSGAWLAERLNTEPPVSRGCSVVEILAILGGAVGLWLPLGGVIGWWQGAFQLGLAGRVVAIVLTMAIAPSVLQRMKRDRPHGYYQHWFAVRLQDRGFLPRAYIEPLGAGRWRAWVDFAIDETVKGMPVKQTLLRYPLEVVRMEVDPEHNPWGLALDGYGTEEPVRLGEDEVKQAFRRPVPRSQPSADGEKDDARS